MKSKSVAVLFATAPIVVSLAAVAVITRNNEALKPAKADENSLVLDSTALENIALEDIDFGKSEGKDKKFRIDLGNDKYIDGAVVFRDCGHQFTGNTLGDAFGINNENVETANAYNFQILFSLESSYDISFDITETSLTKDSSVYTLFQIKYGGFGGENFYNTINDRYGDVIDKTGDPGSLYSNSRSDYLTMNDYTASLTNFKYSAEGYTVAALQITYGVIDNQPGDKYFVKPGNVIEFVLNRIEITYSCSA